MCIRDRLENPWFCHHQGEEEVITSRPKLFAFEQGLGHTERVLEDETQLSQALSDADSKSGTRLLIFDGAVQKRDIQLLRGKLGIPATFLAHVSNEMVDNDETADDPHFAGMGVIVKHPNVPHPCACVSFCAPLLVKGCCMHRHPHRINVARLWVHLILVGNMVVAFTRVGELTLGLFDKHKNKNMFVDPSQILRNIADTMDNEPWEDFEGAYFLLTRVLWGIQTGLVAPSSVSQQAIIDATWHECQQSICDGGQYGALLQHVYTLLQRAKALFKIGVTFKVAVGELITEGWSTSNETEWPDQLLRAELKSLLFAVSDSAEEFDSQVSMVETVIEMWTKRQDLGHVQVNTLLAMVATIFLPLTFLAGVYGTNFTNDHDEPAIPMLNLGNGFWGYMVYWGLSAAFLVGLVVIFVRKGWFALVGLDAKSIVNGGFWDTVCGIALMFGITMVIPLLELIFWYTDVDHLAGDEP
eukprot:TRINITY_DN22960_c0_g1_i1.p1 TRINITY_DN22960_c0_g1~~TRINITY_DN22960_c0_g1_i1.p1  ORF type:complete len:470 (-),score=112.97 TRINITY_DN22960_c0_g1_i1:309-1718(-)